MSEGIIKQQYPKNKKNPSKLNAQRSTSYLHSWLRSFTVSLLVLTICPHAQKAHLK